MLNLKFQAGCTHFSPRNLKKFICRISLRQVDTKSLLVDEALIEENNSCRAMFVKISSWKGNKILFPFFFFFFCGPLTQGLEERGISWYHPS